ncbi:ATP-dependent DNA helicase PcrA, partial [Paenibacillus sp. GYB003]
IGAAPSAAGRAAAGAAQRPAAAGGGAATAYETGDKVSHGKWGTGVVVAVKGSGDDTELQIAFPAPVGVKRLLAKFAPIVKQ